MTLLEDETLLFTRELLRIESVNTGDPDTMGDGEKRAILYVRERLEEAGIATEYAESAPGRANLVARIRGSDPAAPALVAHAHVDVVPVDESEWTHPPFGGEVHDGQLWGRGALDMKSFAGVLLAVARDLARSGDVPRRDLVFAFFSDEEAGGVFGARWVIEHPPEWLAGATEAISEVGGFSVPIGGRRAYLIATAEKGVSSATLTARGLAGHASRPSDRNSVVRLSRAVVALGEHAFPVVPTEATEAFARAVSALLGEEVGVQELGAHLHRLGIAGPLARSGLRSTVSPTVLSAGIKTNVIPGTATARLDARTLPGDDGELERDVRRIVGDEIEVDWDAGFTPLQSPADAPLLAAIQEALTEEDPEGVLLPYLMPASTDNKHLRALGIAGYGFVPLRTEGDFDAFGLYHAADERIPLDALAFSARATRRVLLAV